MPTFAVIIGSPEEQARKMECRDKMRALFEEYRDLNPEWMHKQLDYELMLDALRRNGECLEGKDDK